MTSRALVRWRHERAEHLSDLLLAHRLVGGPARGRRWRTRGLNEALILRLAAEFQGFSRDLHDLACMTFAWWVAPSNPAVEQVVRARLIERRELDPGNARPDSIGNDFARFGFNLWSVLSALDPATTRHVQSLGRLNAARNALAHANDTRLIILRAQGFPIILRTYQRWHCDLDALAGNLDIAVATVQ